MEARGPQRRGSETQPCGEAERRRVPAAEQGDHPVQVVDVDLAADVGATEPELAGARSRCPMARGERIVSVGPLRVDGTRDPSQNSIVKGRSGSARSMLRRSPSVRDPGTTRA